MHRTAGIILWLLLAIVAIAGCSVGSTSGSAGPSPEATSTPGPVLAEPDLKLRLVATYGPLWYCDPDFFPLQRGEEIDSARTRWSEVTADEPDFTAIAHALGLDPAGAFTDDQKLAVYQRWKVLQAIALNPIGNDTYRFDYLAQPKGGAQQGTRTAGRITAGGAITVEQQAPAAAPNCPICLARGARVDTPTGGAAVETLRVGDEVWTLDRQGRLVIGTVIALGSVQAPANHHVVDLVLADGRRLTASPGHPLADGRRLGALRPGDLVDGSPVRAADLVPYAGGRTYDIVVSGPTGIYLVDGIPLRSTIG